MTYAYDDWVQMPTKDLYDTAIMKMAIDAAKDMYDRGLTLMDNFYKTYGDFMSPFAKDMEKYGSMMNNIRTTINDAYARGIDLFKSPEGRMLVLQLSHSIDPTWYNTAKQNAKIGYAYLDAMLDLRKQGKYSEAQELFDILHNKGTLFQDFSTLDDNNRLLTWDRSSPIEATSLRDLTYKSYEHRTPRDITAEDFKNDPRLKGMVYDPRYQYSGYLDSDLMKVAPGASMSLAGDPRAEFFRNEAMKKVIARGGEPTPEAVEAQFQRDIADANAWALIDPTKKADEFAKINYSHKLAMDLENARAANDYNLEKLKQFGKDNTGDLGYSATMNVITDSEGALRGQLMNYADLNAINNIDLQAVSVNKHILDALQHPEKYDKSSIRRMISYAREHEANSENKKISLGLEGVANEVVKLSLSGAHTYFTDKPESINTILRDISSPAVSTSTITNLLTSFGNVSDNGGVFITQKDRLCGVGEVMIDVLSKGYRDGGKHKAIDDAIDKLSKGNLSKYRTAWTSGNTDIRNWTDSGFWQWGGASEFWPTGRVLTGDKHYYIEVSNDPKDQDECCWVKVERNYSKNGGINPVLSSVTQSVDSQFLKDYSHTNVIGNQQSAVLKFNK